MKYLFLILVLSVIGCGKKVTTTKTACQGTWNGNTCVTTTTTTRVKKREYTPEYCDRYMAHADNSYYNCLSGFSAEQR